MKPGITGEDVFHTCAKPPPRTALIARHGPDFHQMRPIVNTFLILVFLTFTRLPSVKLILIKY
jgi:hypothetical protein